MKRSKTGGRETPTLSRSSEETIYVSEETNREFSYVSPPAFEPLEGNGGMQNM